MIREDFLLRAVRIRKNYLSLTNDLDNYLSKVENVSDRLEKTIDEITKIEKEYENSDKKNGKFESDKTLKELLTTIQIATHRAAQASAPRSRPVFFSVDCAYGP